MGNEKPGQLAMPVSVLTSFGRFAGPVLESARVMECTHGLLGCWQAMSAWVLARTEPCIQEKKPRRNDGPHEGIEDTGHAWGRG